MQGVELHRCSSTLLEMASARQNRTTQFRVTSITTLKMSELTKSNEKSGQCLYFSEYAML